MERVNTLFLLTVVVPTLVATIYFAFLASDVYVSQSQFVVRSPDKPAASGLGVLLKSAGFSNAGDEIFATQDYVLSRDALAHAQSEDGDVENAYQQARNLACSTALIPRVEGTFEDLYDYYRGKVGVEHNATSSITTLTVRRSPPQDARRIISSCSTSLKGWSTGSTIAASSTLLQLCPARGARSGSSQPCGRRRRSRVSATYKASSTRSGRPRFNCSWFPSFRTN